MLVMEEVDDEEDLNVGLSPLLALPSEDGVVIVGDLGNGEKDPRGIVDLSTMIGSSSGQENRGNWTFLAGTTAGGGGGGGGGNSSN